jgi:hypothetical protein
MRIQPDEGIMLRFAAKVPGLGIDVSSVSMDFTYGSAFTVDSPDAYETLILDALLGDASLFTRADEVEAAWSIVTPIIETWAVDEPPAFPTTRPAPGAPKQRISCGPRWPTVEADLVTVSVDVHPAGDVHARRARRSRSSPGARGRRRSRASSRSSPGSGATRRCSAISTSITTASSIARSVPGRAS